MLGQFKPFGSEQAMRPRVQIAHANVPEPHEQLDRGAQQLLGIKLDIAQQKPQRGQARREELRNFVETVLSLA